MKLPSPSSTGFYGHRSDCLCSDCCEAIHDAALVQKPTYITVGIQLSGQKIQLADPPVEGGT